MPLPFNTTTHRHTNAHPLPRNTNPISPPGTNPRIRTGRGGASSYRSRPLTVHLYCISDDTFTVHILSRVFSQLTVQVSCSLESSLRYIYYFIRKKKRKKKKRKKKKTKTPSFDASSLLYNHSSPQECTPNTPLHDPYQPTRNESQDKNRSRGASPYRSRPRFVFTMFPMR